MVKKSAVKLIESNEKKMKFQCELCKGTTPHLICIMNKDGNIHVHGPLDNTDLVKDFIGAIINETIKYNKEK